MDIAPHILIIDPASRECGVAVFAGNALQYFATKSLPRRHHTAQFHLLQVKRLTAHLLATFQPKLVILVQKPQPSPRRQATTRQIVRTVRAQALPVAYFTTAKARQIICAAPGATQQETMAHLSNRFPALRHYGGRTTKWQLMYRQHMFAAIAVGYAYVRRYR